MCQWQASTANCPKWKVNVKFQCSALIQQTTVYTRQGTQNTPKTTPTPLLNCIGLLSCIRYSGKATQTNGLIEAYSIFLMDSAMLTFCKFEYFNNGHNLLLVTSKTILPDQVGQLVTRQSDKEKFMTCTLLFSMFAHLPQQHWTA